MCARRTDYVDAPVLLPIPQEQYEKLLKGSKLQPKMREALWSPPRAGALRSSEGAQKNFTAPPPKHDH